MAPGVVCVTSLRLFVRRSDFCQLSRRGLRLTPPTTFAVNSWHLRGRSYSSAILDTTEQQYMNSGASNSNAATTHAKQLCTSAAFSSNKKPTERSSDKKAQKTLSKDELKLKDVKLEKLKISELQHHLNAFGLDARGKKDVIIERLRVFLAQQPNTIVTRNDDDYDDNNARSREAAAVDRTCQTDAIHDMTSSDSQKQKATTLRLSTASEIDIDTVSINPITHMSPPLPSSSFKLQPETKASYPSQTSSYHQEYSNTQLATSASHSNGSGEDACVKEPPTTNSQKGPLYGVDSWMKTNHNGDVTVEYIQGLPHITVPLPSRHEKCRFALKPVSHRVGDLITMLKLEDRGIDRATILDKTGIRIASTCNIESLMDEPFWLQINEKKYKVVPPERERIGVEDLSKLNDVRALVAQLYEALHVGEYHLEKEQELESKLENLKYQISPMERLKTELHHQAERKTNVMTWFGLGLMSVQFGILARLTWWEYSWDIMEPVTYFVTYGTAMAMYAYYCITKTEYNLNDVKDREYLLTMHKRAKKKNFDMDAYNTLRRQIAETEYDLRRLRDPLNLQLPPHIDRSQQGPPSGSLTLDDDGASTKTKSSFAFKFPFLDSKDK